MKLRYALIAAAGMLAGISSAHAANDGGKAGPDMERMAVLLELDDAQKAEVERILTEQREAIRSAREQARQSGTRPTREEVQQKRAEHKQQTLAKLQAVLTPEQIKKFEALHAGKKRGGKHRHE